MPSCYNIQNTDKRYLFSLFLEYNKNVRKIDILQDSANKGLVQEIVFLVFHRCLYNKQNITWPLVDTNIMFSCSTRYLTSEGSKQVRYLVENSKIKSVSTRSHVISSILYVVSEKKAAGSLTKLHKNNVLQFICH